MVLRLVLFCFGPAFDRVKDHGYRLLATWLHDTLNDESQEGFLDCNLGFNYRYCINEFDSSWVVW